jgi:ABC-type branched-subunit amino acid transport system substrate-binding protein
MNRKAALLLSLTSGLTAVACAGILGIPEDRVLGTTTTDGGNMKNDAPISAQTCKQSTDCPGTQLCNSTKLTCVEPITARCPKFIGDKNATDALTIGAIVPLTGINKSVGEPMVHALELGRQELLSIGWLPGKVGGAARQVNIVVCDDAAATASGVEAADQLVNGVGVPVILGNTFSGVTLEVAKQQTIPKGVLLIGAGITGTVFETISDNGLVWRTIASGTLQMLAFNQLVASIETQLKAVGGLPTGSIPPDNKIRVAMIHKGDSFGVSFGDASLNSLNINGVKPTDPATFIRIDYGNTGTLTAEQAKTKALETASTLAGFKPHIILGFGLAEMLDVIKATEIGWGGSENFRPRWLLAHSNYAASTTQWLGDATNPIALGSGENVPLRKRILGTISGSHQGDSFKGFSSAYKAQFSDTNPETFGTPNAYDSFYLTMFAVARAAGSDGSGAITGASLADALKAVGAPVGPARLLRRQDFAAGIQDSASKVAFNIEGASGPLDFNPDTGEPNSETQVWCVDAGNQLRIVKDYYFDVAAAPKGTVNQVKTVCGF